MLYISVMREVDLRRIDLNLLVVLDRLLSERNVTRAADRLGMSQPAASRALGRLRRLFSDALLVDGPGGYVLSARAAELQPLLRQLLDNVGDMLQANSFDPKIATGRVRLLMPDLQSVVLAPPLLARLAQEAPALDLDIVPPGADVMDTLEQGRADAMVGLIEEAPAGIRQRHLYDEELVTLMRAHHPAVGQDLTLESFLVLEHIVVSVTGAGSVPVDDVLKHMGRTRRVKLRVPNFLAALEIAGRTDLVMTLPLSLARLAADTGRFVALPPPLALGRFPMSLVWHARQQEAPRHVWLRRTIVAAAMDAVS